MVDFDYYQTKNNYESNLKKKIQSGSDCQGASENFFILKFYNRWDLKAQIFYFACTPSPTRKRDDFGTSILQKKSKKGGDPILDGSLHAKIGAPKMSHQEEGCLRGLHAKNKSASTPPYFSSRWSSLFYCTKSCITNL